jgi:hypothetical protein
MNNSAYPQYQVFKNDETCFILSYIAESNFTFIERYENDLKYGSLMLKERLNFDSYESIKTFYYEKKGLEKVLSVGKFPAIAYRNTIEIAE